MNNQQISRLTYLCEHIENDIQNLKDELLIAMIQEQSKLLDTKYDRTNYHLHKIKENLWTHIWGKSNWKQQC